MIRQWQPWNHSTGAKTIEGKAITSQNGYKGGVRELLQQLAKYLKQQEKAIN